ncbi:hypothetical protein NpPPO83_00000528 [Neofusicoccum parvum]|uniref:Uncharacterized protein n=1 Tax=Neofusicoccum parvum TaxID=310453 RepID=A0ACB5SIS9_9PEZI|nr:hypothetical protein NpPPO83_00000528 [Neofusicoccum parvum]
MTPKSREWGDYNIVPSLILINKAAYTEAAHLLYRNKFRFANAKTMYYFITTISPKMKGMIERIELANERLPGWAHLYSQRNHDPRYMALAFPSLIGMNLKSLELAMGFDMDDWACAYSLANFLSRNGFGHWLRWTAQEKGDPKAARDILNLREDGALRWLGRMVAYRGGVSLKYIVSRHSGAGSLAPASETEQEEIWESFKRFLGA